MFNITSWNECTTCLSLTRSSQAPDCKCLDDHETLYECGVCGELHLDYDDAESCLKDCMIDIQHYNI